LLSKVKDELSKLCAEQDTLLDARKIPSEKATLQALEAHELLAKQLAHVRDRCAPVPEELCGPSAAASLLDLSLDRPKQLRRTTEIHMEIDQLSRQLSDTTFRLLSHPNVFIGPKLLAKFVNVHCHLQDPNRLVEAFELYASKPIPIEDSDPVAFTTSSPDSVSMAVPPHVASRALQIAVDARSLPAAMGLVAASSATTASRKAKFVRHALLPAVGLSLAPLAAWALASQFAQWQTSMDPATATNVAFAGLLAYAGFTSVVGLVAITTANDQMDRVTWAPGIPLRERWLREHERAAVDRVAAAWGFGPARRGEEEGADWDTIKTWVGLKGMILDRVELMEGME
jgi:hypothetical protein